MESINYTHFPWICNGIKEMKRSMKNVTKISALISLFIVVIMFVGAVSAANSKSVDDTMSNYGAPPQGDNVNGIPVFINDEGYAIPIHFLTNMQYREMWKKIAKWQAAQHTTRLPSYVDITYMKVGINKVTKSQFLDMKKRWDAWKKTHNGKEPNIIGIELPIGTIYS